MQEDVTIDLTPFVSTNDCMKLAYLVWHYVCHMANRGTYKTFRRHHIDTNHKAKKILPYYRKERKIASFTLLEEIIFTSMNTEHLLMFYYLVVDTC